MRATSILAAIFAMSFSMAHAAPAWNGGHGGDDSASCESKESFCKKANLDDAQKAQIKEAKAQLKEKMKAMRPQVAAAYKKFMDVVKDPNANLAAAQAATQELNEVRGQMQAATEETKLNILFTIAKPEQRMNLLHCMIAHGRGHGHGGHHGGHDGDNGGHDGDDNGEAPAPTPEEPTPVPAPEEPAPAPMPPVPAPTPAP